MYIVICNISRIKYINIKLWRPSQLKNTQKWLPVSCMEWTLAWGAVLTLLTQCRNKSNVKSINIISWHILNMQLVLKCILKGVKAKKLFSLECCLPFKSSNGQTFNIYSGHRWFLMCSSNPNTIINIGKFKDCFLTSNIVLNWLKV